MSEALRLADALEQQFPIGTAQHYLDGEAAAELRRLHALNAELVEALKHAAECVQTNYLPDKCGHDWDDVIAKAEASHGS